MTRAPYAASLAAAKARAAGRKNNATPPMARCGICAALVYPRDKTAHLRGEHSYFGARVDEWFTAVEEHE